MGLDPAFLCPGDWVPVLSGSDHAEAFLEESIGASIQFEDGRLQEMASGSDQGVGLRYLVAEDGGFRTLHGSLNGLRPEDAAALSGRLLRGVARRPAPPAGELLIRRSTARRDPFSVPMEEKVAMLAQADRAVRSEFPHIVQVSLLYAERRKRCAVFDSAGGRLFSERVSVIFSVGVTASKDGLLQTGYEVLGGPLGYELIEGREPLRLARCAARLAVAKLSAPTAPAGEMPVVLSSSAGGTFIHEAIGHSLEADHVQEGSSPHYAGKLGKAVAGLGMVVIDDPTLPFARGSYEFDDEGVLARPTPVVQDGVLVDYLYDRVTSMRDGKPSNGHGRRESFRHRPIPRMSNLYIAPGTDDPAAIIRSVEKGLFVTRMGGGQVNTATGEFLFGVDEGYWIEGGKVRHLVRDANLLGLGPEVLLSIDRLGWDIGWGIGTCGKEGQSVPVSDGQPTLRIPKVVVGGREAS